MEREVSNDVLVIEVDAAGNITVKARDGIQPPPCAAPIGTVEDVHTVTLVTILMDSGLRKKCYKRPDGTWFCIPP
jgi:hypothetical protein